MKCSRKGISHLLPKNLLRLHDVPKILRCPVKRNTFGIKQTIAFFCQNYMLRTLHPALDINRTNCTHREEGLRNLLIEL